MEPDFNGNSYKEPEYLSHDITGMKLAETKIPEGREACLAIGQHKYCVFHQKIKPKRTRESFERH